MRGLDKINPGLPYLATLPNGTDNAQCCCPRCNLGKETFTLDSCEAHYILILTNMQDPTMRAKYGMTPKPLPLPACFHINPNSDAASDSVRV